MIFTLYFESERMEFYYWIIICESGYWSRVEFEAAGKIKIQIGLESWKMCVKGGESVFCVSIWKDEVRFCWEGAGKWWVSERKTRIDVFVFAGQGSDLAQLRTTTLQFSSLNHQPQPIYSCLIFSDKFIAPN